MFDLEADRSFGRRWSLSTWIGLFFGLNGPFFDFETMFSTRCANKPCIRAREGVSSLLIPNP